MQLAYESHSPNNCRTDNAVLVRLCLGHDDELLAVQPGHTPMLFAEALRDYRHNLLERHVAAARTLRKRGFKHVVIAADQDGAWQKILSPRFSSGDLCLRMAELLATFQAVAKIISEVWVLLNVEELTPGGMDATDGIIIAQALEALGLTNIIASSGSKDFPPLYDRRSTEIKSGQITAFHSHEPDLAAAWWLKKHSGLKVWALSQIDHEASALAIAQAIGLTGLIKKAHK